MSEDGSQPIHTATLECLLEIARALSYDKPQSKHFKVALQRIADIVSKQGVKV